MRQQKIQKIIIGGNRNTEKVIGGKRKYRKNNERQKRNRQIKVEK